MKTHKFDVDDAKKYGIEKAILLEHLKFHQQSNEGNELLQIDGKSFAFIKPSTIEKMYPYMNYKSVQRWLNELEEDGVIESCKPKAKQGNHLKYYHVKSISQNENSISQKQDIQISQNETSSILPNEEPNEGETSFFDVIDMAESKNELLDVWDMYRKSKGKHMNLYEREILMKSTWKNKTVSQIKNSILYTIENGWLTLQEQKSEQEPKPSYYKEL